MYIVYIHYTYQLSLHLYMYLTKRKQHMQGEYGVTQIKMYLQKGFNSLGFASRHDDFIGVDVF